MGDFKKTFKKAFLFSVFFTALTGTIFAFIIHRTERDSLPEGGNFVLQGGKGDWELVKGATGKKLVLLFFGFTRCPDMCPTTLATLSKAIKSLPEKQQDQVLVVFVSVDYRSDEPKKVSEYVSFFDPRFVGLTGTQKGIDQVVKQFGTSYAFTDLPGSALKYTVDHSGTVSFLSPKGKVLNRAVLFSDVNENQKLIQQFL